MAETEAIAEDMTDTELAKNMGDALDDAAEKLDPNDDVDDEDLDDEDDGLDDEDDDVDDDLDEDEDEDDDLDEEEEADEGGETLQAEEPITREDGATWNAKANRWVKDGAFVEGDPPKAKEDAANPADGKAAPAAGADGKATPAAAAAPQWQPLAVKVNGKDNPIPEVAGIREHEGHYFIAVPKDKYNDFTRRIGLGILGAQHSRALQDGLKELDRRQQAWDAGERPKSDAEIEAEIWMEAVKPFLAEHLDEKDLTILEHKVQDAQRAEKERWTSKEKERVQAGEAARADEDTQQKGLANTIVELAEANPETKDLTTEQLREVLADLQEVKDSLFFKSKDGKDWYRRTGPIERALRSKAAEVKAGKAGAAATAKPGDGGKPADKPAEPTAQERKADQHNAGVNAAAAPKTTSVKAQPVTRSAQRGNREDRRNGKRRRNKGKTRAQRAEDRWNRTKKDFMSSPGLDFPVR